MFCEKCGKQINDGAVFCPFCGHSMDAVAEETPIQTMSSSSRSITEKANRSGKGKKWIIAGVATIVVATIVILVVSISKKPSGTTVVWNNYTVTVPAVYTVDESASRGNYKIVFVGSNPNYIIEVTSLYDNNDDGWTDAMIKESPETFFDEMPLSPEEVGYGEPETEVECIYTTKGSFFGTEVTYDIIRR